MEDLLLRNKNEEEEEAEYIKCIRVDVYTPKGMQHNVRRGCRINGDRLPKQRLPTRGVQGRVPLGNVMDFLFLRSPFWSF